MIYQDPSYTPLAPVVLEILIGLAAFQVMESTACDSATALAAMRRQVRGHADDPITAQAVMDRISAACLDVVEGH
jgi:hypothetical protein